MNLTRTVLYYVLFLSIVMTCYSFVANKYFVAKSTSTRVKYASVDFRF